MTLLPSRLAFAGGCFVTVSTMNHVHACPQSEKEWNFAARRKNCESLAKIQKCEKNPKRFKYHCVMNAWANGTIEVCAPVRFSQGYCVQFSHYEGQIKDNDDFDCTKFPDPCPSRYRSDEAYKYPMCYKHIRRLDKSRGYDVHVTLPNISQAGQPTQGTALQGSPSEVPTNLTLVKTSLDLHQNQLKVTNWILIVLLACSIIGYPVLLVCCKVKKRKSGACTCRRMRNLSICVFNTDHSEQRTEHTGQLKEESQKLITIDEISKTECSSREDGFDKKIEAGTTQVPTVGDVESQTDGNNKIKTASGGNDISTSSLPKVHSSEVSSKKLLCPGLPNLKGCTDLEQYKDKDPYYVESKMYHNITQKLERQHVVVLTGNPGCGKTNTAFHITLRHACEGWAIKIETESENINRLSSGKNKEKTLLFIDNLFDEMSDIDTLKCWRTALNDIYKKRSETMRIVITTKKNLLKWANERIGHSNPIYILDDKHQFNMSSNDFSDEEKKNILERQLQFAQDLKRCKKPSLDRTEFDQILRSEAPIGFPLCAHLYAFEQKYQTVRFFSNPFPLFHKQIKAVLEKDKSKGSETLFILLFIYETHFRQEKCDLSDKTKCEECARLFIDTSKFNFENLIETANRYLGSFVIEIDKCKYAFVHKSVYEAVESYVFEAYFECDQSLFSIDVVKSQVFIKDSDSSFTHFKIAKKYYKSLALFIKCQVLKGKVSDVCEAKFLHDETFTNALYKITKKWKLKELIEFLTTKNKSKIECPIPFWTQRYGGSKFIMSLVEYVEEAKKKGCEDENDMLEKGMSLLPYYDLFGEVSARTREQYITKHMPTWYDEKLIKFALWNFCDEKGYTTLHLLILSEKSDQLVVEIIKSMADDNLKVNDQSNQYQYTPLMSAITHWQDRFCVIQELLTRGAKLHLKDARQDTAFHHCVKTNKNDSECFQILQILFDKSNDFDKNILNNAGQTILNLAAMQEKYSRILCILLLLQKGCDVSLLDWKRASPIYNTVSFLKRLEGHQKLERLLRVCIFLLNKDEPYTDAKGGKCALTICKEQMFETLEDLFACNNDQKTMANLLQGHIKMSSERKTSEKYAHLLSNFDDRLKELILAAITILSQTSLY